MPFIYTIRGQEYSESHMSQIAANKGLTLDRLLEDNKSKITITLRADAIDHANFWSGNTEMRKGRYDPKTSITLDGKTAWTEEYETITETSTYTPKVDKYSEYHHSIHAPVTSSGGVDYSRVKDAYGNLIGSNVPTDQTWGVRDAPYLTGSEAYETYPDAKKCPYGNCDAYDFDCPGEYDEVTKGWVDGLNFNGEIYNGCSDADGAKVDLGDAVVVGAEPGLFTDHGVSSTEEWNKKHRKQWEDEQVNRIKKEHFTYQNGKWIIDGKLLETISRELGKGGIGQDGRFKRPENGGTWGLKNLINWTKKNSDKDKSGIGERLANVYMHLETEINGKEMFLNKLGRLQLRDDVDGEFTADQKGFAGWNYLNSASTTASEDGVYSNIMPGERLVITTNPFADTDNGNDFMEWSNKNKGTNFEINGDWTQVEDYYKKERATGGGPDENLWTDMTEYHGAEGEKAKEMQYTFLKYRMFNESSKHASDNHSKGEYDRVETKNTQKGELLDNYIFESGMATPYEVSEVFNIPKEYLKYFSFINNGESGFVAVLMPDGKELAKKDGVDINTLESYTGDLDESLEKITITEWEEDPDSPGEYLTHATVREETDGEYESRVSINKQVNDYLEKNRVIYEEDGMSEEEILRRIIFDKASITQIIVQNKTAQDWDWEQKTDDEKFVSLTEQGMVSSEVADRTSFKNRFNYQEYYKGASILNSAESDLIKAVNKQGIASEVSIATSDVENWWWSDNVWIEELKRNDALAGGILGSSHDIKYKELNGKNAVSKIQSGDGNPWIVSQHAEFFDELVFIYQPTGEARIYKVGAGRDITNIMSHVQSWQDSIVTRERKQALGVHGRYINEEFIEKIKTDNIIRQFNYTTNIVNTKEVGFVNYNGESTAIQKYTETGYDEFAEGENKVYHGSMEKAIQYEVKKMEGEPVYTSSGIVGKMVGVSSSILSSANGGINSTDEEYTEMLRKFHADMLLDIQIVLAEDMGYDRDSGETLDEYLQGEFNDGEGISADRWNMVSAEYGEETAEILFRSMIERNINGEGLAVGFDDFKHMIGTGTGTGGLFDAARQELDRKVTVLGTKKFMEGQYYDPEAGIGGAYLLRDIVVQKYIEGVKKKIDDIALLDPRSFARHKMFNGYIDDKGETQFGRFYYSKKLNVLDKELKNIQATNETGEYINNVDGQEDIEFEKGTTDEDKTTRINEFRNERIDYIQNQIKVNKDIIGIFDERISKISMTSTATLQSEDFWKDGVFLVTNATSSLNALLGNQITNEWDQRIMAPHLDPWTSNLYDEYGNYVTDKDEETKKNEEAGYISIKETEYDIFMQEFQIEYPTLTNQEGLMMFFNKTAVDFMYWENNARDTYVTLDLSAWWSSGKIDISDNQGSFSHKWENTIHQLSKRKTQKFPDGQVGNKYLVFSTYDLLKAGIDARDFTGALDFISSDISMTDEDIATLTQDEKIRDTTNGKLKALHKLAYLGIDPEEIYRGSAPVLFWEAAERAFETSWLDYSEAEAMNLMGTYEDKSPMLDIIQTAGNEYTEFQQDFNNSIYENAINNIESEDTEGKLINLLPEFQWSKAANENFQRSLIANVAEGAGSFVPLLVELAAITVATEGTMTWAAGLRMFKGLKDLNTLRKAVKMTKLQRQAAFKVGEVGHTIKFGHRATVFATELALEEFKMQMAGFKPTSGSAFYIGGASTQWLKIPIFGSKMGAWNWMARNANPFVQKLIKPGVVGAASMEFASVTEAAWMDAMGGFGHDFGREMNQLYGDVSETTKRIITNALMFSVIGQLPSLHPGARFAKTHWEKKDFQFFRTKISTKGNIDAMNELKEMNNRLIMDVVSSEKGGDKLPSTHPQIREQKNLEKQIADIKQKYGLSKKHQQSKRKRRKAKHTTKEYNAEVLQKLYNLEFRVKMIKNYNKLGSKNRDIYDARKSQINDIYNMHLEHVYKNKLDINNPNFEGNFKAIVMDQFNAQVRSKDKKHIDLEYEFVNKPGEMKSLKLEPGETALFIETGSGKADKVIFDFSKFDAGKATHEVFMHALLKATFKKSPELKLKFGNSVFEIFEKHFKGKDIIVQGKKVSTGAFKEWMESERGYGDKSWDVKQEEYLAFIAEIMTNPEMYYQEVAPTFLKEVLQTSQNYIEENWGWTQKGTDRMSPMQLFSMFARLGKNTREGKSSRFKLKRITELDQISFMDVKLAEYTMNNHNTQMASKEMTAEFKSLIQSNKDLANSKPEGYLELIETNVLRIKELKDKGVTKDNVKTSVDNARNVKKYKEGLDLMSKDKVYQELLNELKEVEKIKDIVERGIKENAIRNKILNYPKPPGMRNAETQLIESNMGHITNMLAKRPSYIEKSDWESATYSEVSKIIKTYDAVKYKDVPFGAYFIETLHGKPGTRSAGIGRWGNIEKAAKNLFSGKVGSVDAIEGGYQNIKTGVNMKSGSKVDINKAEWMTNGIKIKESLKRDGNLIIDSKTIESIEAQIKNLDLENINFSNLKDLQPEITKELFGVIYKANGKLDGPKTNQKRAEFIAENWKVIYDILPKGAMLETGKTEIEGLSTLIESTLLNDLLYTKRSRIVSEGALASAAKTGKGAGLKVQEKIEGLSQVEFLNKFGIKIIDGVVTYVGGSQSKQSRAIDGLQAEVGRLLSNQTVREALSDGKHPELLQKINEQQLARDLMAGKSEKMASMDFNAPLWDLMTKNGKIIGSKKAQIEFDKWILRGVNEKAQNAWEKKHPDLALSFIGVFRSQATEIGISQSASFMKTRLLESQEVKYTKAAKTWLKENGYEKLSKGKGLNITQSKKEYMEMVKDNTEMFKEMLENIPPVLAETIPMLLDMGNFVYGTIPVKRLGPEQRIDTKGKKATNPFKNDVTVILSQKAKTKDFFGTRKEFVRTLGKELGNKKYEQIQKLLETLKTISVNRDLSAYGTSQKDVYKQQAGWKKLTETTKEGKKGSWVKDKDFKNLSDKQIDIKNLELTKEFYESDAAVTKDSFANAFNELMEIYVHNTEGKSKFTKEQRQNFVINNLKNNSQAGMTGARIWATTSHIRMLDAKTFKNYEKSKEYKEIKEANFGKTENQLFDLYIAKISKFEHLKPSAHQSFEVMKHIINGTYSTVGKEMTKETWTGIKGLEKEFDLIDFNFGEESRAGVFRFAQQLEMAKGIVNIKKLIEKSKTMSIKEMMEKGEIPTLYNDMLTGLGKARMERYQELASNVNKTKENNREYLSENQRKASKEMDWSHDKIFNKLSAKDKALELARGIKKKKDKGISVWDFDDTIAYTKSGVRYTLPNPSGKPAPQKKVIFMAGGPGSGKSNVVKQLKLEDMGFKIVNQDISLEWLMKNHGLPADMREFTDLQKSKFSLLTWKAAGIAAKKQMKYQGKGDGVVVDGTGANLKTMNKLVTEFKNKGYDVGMVFVETSKDVAIARNKARPERSLRDFIVKQTWDKVQGNKDVYREMFGGRFAEVNTDNLKQGDKMPSTLTNIVHDYVGGYKKGRLNAGEFADKGQGLKEQGAEFDFTEFDYVKEGKKGPFFEKAQKRIDKFGSKNQYILTARPPAAQLAIHLWMERMGLKIPKENITGLGNSTAEAKADWMVEKAGEGFNDFYFADDAVQNVKAVKEALNVLDVKSWVQQANRKASKDMHREFNEILEGTLGVKWKKEYSDVQAKLQGKKKGKWNYIMSPSAQDFKGLLYNFLGKGKQGEAQMEWFEEKLIKPFARGNNDLNTHKQTLRNDFNQLNKTFKEVKKDLKEIVEGTNLTYEHAIRIHRWTEAGYEIPGLSKRDLKKMNDVVKNDHELMDYSQVLGEITKLERGYDAPGEYWLAEGILTDLSNITDKIARKSYLNEFVENKNIIFSKKNLNKIEAQYGSKFREALQDSIWAMETGQTRKEGSNRLVNKYMNWVNNSVGVIMFANMRSAALQTISSMNYMNWKENNPLKAAAAFANLPQFGKDFAYIFNSSMLKQRRAGLKHGVNEAELAEVLVGSKGSPKAALAWLLKKGFLPTQIADSFAISMGGAAYYRNRINMYKKLNPKWSNKKIEKQAWLDFQEVTEVSQQSSRADLISQQQRSPLGRLILAFGNTPMQYARIMNKSARDLANNRGDAKSNISKIVYYGLLQSAMFTALQSFLTGFSMDEEDEDYDKSVGLLNGMVNNTLRGFGLGGVVVSTLKDTSLQFHRQQKKKMPDHAYTILQLMNFSPPAGSKIRKIYSATQTWKYDEDLIKEMGLDIDNPANLAVANIISATTNVPLDRLVMKINNIRESLDSRNSMIQRMASGMGWSNWVTGVQNEELIAFKEDFKETQKIKKKETKEEVKIDKKMIELRLKYPDLTYKQIKKKIELDKKGKDLFNLSKREQNKLLEALDIDPDDFKKEADRVNKILELYQSDSATTQSTIQAREDHVPTKEEKREIELYTVTKKDQVNILIGFGLSLKKIRELKYEEDRVEMIIKLENKKKKREAVLQ